MATNSMLTAAPMRQVSSAKKSKKKGPPHDVTPKDMARERNMTKAGKPRLNATSGSGEGSMGQRR